VPAHGMDQDQMLLLVGVEAPDHQPEEPASALGVRARTGTKRDVESVPQEQVLDHKVVTSAREPGQSGEEEAD
jgi:hypothetical protein